MKWFRLSSNQDYALGQFNLAWCYEYGHGVEKNIKRAVDLYRKAAADEVYIAQDKLQRLDAD